LLRKEVRRICTDIKSMKIKGARKIAIAAVNAMNLQARLSDAKNADGFYSDLIEAADELASARPTEPMLRNAIRFLFFQLKKEKNRDVRNLKKCVERESKEYLLNIERGLTRIAEFGAKRIPDGSNILIHCHSSTLMSILKRAYDMGKGFSVTCTETRPLFQGRISARELGDYGIDTTLVIDSAMASVMPDMDMVLVGADAITSSGDLINKIGTSSIAHIAANNDVKFYSAAELFKYDPLTRWGGTEEIEERDPSEVADPSEFKTVKIKNPAFDITPAKYISAYITEIGIIPPGSLFGMVARKFDVEVPL
jgi:ribose 1,5-bisphosphate isomerase